MEDPANIYRGSSRQILLMHTQFFMVTTVPCPNEKVVIYLRPGGRDKRKALEYLAFMLLSFSNAAQSSLYESHELTMGVKKRLSIDSNRNGKIWFISPTMYS
jgi:hypothetical protein